MHASWMSGTFDADFQCIVNGSGGRARLWVKAETFHLELLSYFCSSVRDSSLNAGAALHGVCEPRCGDGGGGPAAHGL